MTMTGEAVSADGTRLAWGKEGQGPGLLVIDPILVDRSASPISDLAGLLRDEFTVCRFDRRGKGASTDGDEYQPEREVEDIRAVIEDAKLGPAPTVFGFSSGGSLAVLAAGSGVPMSSLIVLEPPVDLPDPSEFIEGLGALIAAGDRTGAILRLFRYQGMPEEVVESMAPAAEALSENAHTMAYDLHVISRLDPMFLTKSSVPTLALASAASPPQLIEFARKVAEHGPDARGRQLDGDWHGVSDDLLAAAISDFADSQTG